MHHRFDRIDSFAANYTESGDPACIIHEPASRLRRAVRSSIETDDRLAAAEVEATDYYQMQLLRIGQKISSGCRLHVLLRVLR